MNLFGLRVVSGVSLDTLVKEHNKQYNNKVSRNDFYHLFFTKTERKIINTIYMTVYENKKGKQYVIFTNNIPSPCGKFFTNTDHLIGETTGYNTRIISCEKCYIIG